jgi:hypothetical protein
MGTRVRATNTTIHHGIPAFKACAGDAGHDKPFSFLK